MSQGQPGVHFSPHQSQEPGSREKWQAALGQLACSLNVVALLGPHDDGHHLQVPMTCRRRAPKCQVPLIHQCMCFKKGIGQIWEIIKKFAAPLQLAKFHLPKNLLRSRPLWAWFRRPLLL